MAGAASGVQSGAAGPASQLAVGTGSPLTKPALKSITLLLAIEVCLLERAFGTQQVNTLDEEPGPLPT